MNYNLIHKLMEKKIFQNDAKQMVDMMFETKLLREDITRDLMSTFEDLIQFLLESRYDSYVKIEKVLKSIKK